MNSIQTTFAAVVAASSLAMQQNADAQTLTNVLQDSATMYPNTFLYSSDTSIDGITANLAFTLTGDVTTPDVVNNGIEQFRNDLRIDISLLNTNGDRDYISEFTSVTGNLTTFTDLGVNNGGFNFSFVDDTFLTNHPDLAGESGRDSFRSFSINISNVDLAGLSNQQQFTAVFGGLDQFTAAENNFEIGGDLWAILPGNDDQPISFNNFEAVPEPTTTALLVLGAGALLTRRQRAANNNATAKNDATPSTPANG